MTPSFRGRTATMLPGVRPIIFFASAPTARMPPVLVLIATTDGSLSTIPRPLTYTSVLAVPRSTAMSRPMNDIEFPIRIRLAFPSGALDSFRWGGEGGCCDVKAYIVVSPARTLREGLRHCHQMTLRLACGDGRSGVGVPPNATHMPRDSRVFGSGFPSGHV